MRVEIVAGAVVAILATACSAPRDVDERARQLDRALSSSNDPDAIRERIAEETHKFLVAFSRSDQSAATFVDVNVHFIDGSLPLETVQSGETKGAALIKGRLGAGGYFTLLSINPRPNLATDQIDVHLIQKDYALVVATPEHEKPLITTWERRRAGWIITSVELNVPDDWVRRVRLYAAKAY